MGGRSKGQIPGQGGEKRDGLPRGGGGWRMHGTGHVPAVWHGFVMGEKVCEIVGPRGSE